MTTPAVPAPLTPARRWLLLVTVSAGVLLITLDNTILYTDLPTLTAELGARAAESLWIINAYPLVMCGLLLGAGTLGDRSGHRRLFLTGLVIFGAASLGGSLRAGRIRPHRRPCTAGRGGGMHDARHPGADPHRVR